MNETEQFCKDVYNFILGDKVVYKNEIWWISGIGNKDLLFKGSLQVSINKWSTRNSNKNTKYLIFPRDCGKVLKLK